MKKIYTIGHSNIDKEQFVKMLEKAHITHLVDVRSLPGSRKFPQFNQENMVEWLANAGIDYTYIKDLGGRRNKLATEVANEGWEHPAFKNYADYTTTDGFRAALSELEHLPELDKTAIMCAEHHPSRCHRSIISDNLTADGFTVTHILPDAKDDVKLAIHEYGAWGAKPIVTKGLVAYPKIVAKRQVTDPKVVTDGQMTSPKVDSETVEGEPTRF
jgi:uncharacterized protein (DUF488 family)